VIVEKLSLENYRNISLAHLTHLGRNVVLLGANGAGKTNILEALSMFCSGKGLRGAFLDDLIKNDKPFARLRAEIQGSPQNQVFFQEFKKPSQKILRMDNAAVRSAKSFEKELHILWLTPETTLLFLMPSGERRRFFDRLIAMTSPMHGKNLYRFEHYMKERSKALKLGVGSPVWLQAIEQNMSEWAYHIVMDRQNFLDHFNDFLHQKKNITSKMSPSCALPFIQLNIESEEHLLLSQGNFLSHYQEKLYNARAYDAQAGGAKHGPHKADFSGVFGDEKCPIRQCSTGQQKMFLITFMFRFIQYIQTLPHEKGANRMLFLLDDMVAHLDYAHRLMLFDDICKNPSNKTIQTWMSGTEYANFTPIKECSSFFQISQGVVTSMS
jgi:DNA replication and repair protein RecF